MTAWSKQSRRWPYRNLLQVFDRWDDQLIPEPIVAHEADEKAERLARFTDPLAAHDAETIDFWRDASAVENAAAMIHLSEYAEQMAPQIGVGEDAAEMFPGFPRRRGASSDAM